MDVILGPALALLYHLIDLYAWVLIIGVIMIWLIAFNVINLSNLRAFFFGTPTSLHRRFSDEEICDVEKSYNGPVAKYIFACDKQLNGANYLYLNLKYV